MLNEDELRDALLLVFANKQDLPNAMNAAEITDKLGLHSLRNRRWYIQTTCATSGKSFLHSVVVSPARLLMLLLRRWSLRGFGMVVQQPEERSINTVRYTHQYLIKPKQISQKILFWLKSFD